MPIFAEKYGAMTMLPFGKRHPPTNNPIASVPTRAIFETILVVGLASITFPALKGTHTMFPDGASTAPTDAPLDKAVIGPIFEKAYVTGLNMPTFAEL
jgi:hypothetical protein